MISSVVFFDKIEDLLKLTNLSDKRELWGAGFDLDDWDWGFESTHSFGEMKEDEDGMIWHDHSDYSAVPAPIRKVLDWMDDYCSGYKVTEYNGKYYFIVYHS